MTKITTAKLIFLKMIFRAYQGVPRPYEPKYTAIDLFPSQNSSQLEQRSLEKSIFSKIDMKN